jgi:hypothetical protein
MHWSEGFSMISSSKIRIPNGREGIVTWRCKIRIWVESGRAMRV